MSGSPERYCNKCGCRCHCYAPECPNCANDVCYTCDCDICSKNDYLNMKTYLIDLTKSNKGKLYKGNQLIF